MEMKKLLTLAGFLAFVGSLWFVPVMAHAQNASVATTCGVTTFPVGYGPYNVMMDVNGNLCIKGSVTPTAAAPVARTVTGGTITTHLTFQSALAAGASRVDCTIQNTSTDTEYVFEGAPGGATTAASWQLKPGGTYLCTGNSGVSNSAQLSITSAVTDGATYVVGNQ